MAKLLWLIIASVIVAVVISSNSSKDATSSSTTPAKVANKPTLDKSDKMQKNRQELLGKLIGEKVFTKYETGAEGTARAYVAPRFYTLDFDTKTKFVSVVYAYYFDGSGNYEAVRLIDSKNNKTVGRFTKETGLSLD